MAGRRINPPAVEVASREMVCRGKTKKGRTKPLAVETTRTDGRRRISPPAIEAAQKKPPAAETTRINGRRMINPPAIEVASKENEKRGGLPCKRRRRKSREERTILSSLLYLHLRSGFRLSVGDGDGGGSNRCRLMT